MKTNKSQRLRYAYIVLTGLFFFNLAACKKGVESETLVYRNDFEARDLKGIVRANISSYKNSKMLGFFNNGNCELSLEKLPAHNYIRVSFDLYIIDSWDGNKEGTDGPDFWEMSIDGQSYLKTTFAYRPCGGLNCNSQAYPDAYPAINYPRTGSDPVLISGGCVLAGEKDGTGLYHFTRLIPHSGSAFTMTLSDHLKQTGLPDSARICDESWALDNLTIKTVQVK